MCGHWGGGPSERPAPHHTGSCNDPVNQEWHGWKDLDIFSNEARYYFYYDRHANHLHSLDFAEELRERIAAASTEMEIDEQTVDLVRESAELLIECRRYLAWTYVWAFFEQDEANRKAFEHAQGELETKTEQLSEMVEGDPKQMSTSWLWVAMSSQQELDNLVMESPEFAKLNQRTKLADHVSSLHIYLENIKQVVATSISAEPQPHRQAAAATVSPKPKARPKRAVRPKRIARRR